MGKLNMKEWISQTIQRKETIAIPIMTHPGIEFIGKTVHDAVTNGQVHYEAIKALCDKYPAAAATVIMDLTVEAEAFGAEIILCLLPVLQSCILQRAGICPVHSYYGIVFDRSTLPDVRDVPRQRFLSLQSSHYWQPANDIHLLQNVRLPVSQVRERSFLYLFRYL